MLTSHLSTDCHSSSPLSPSTLSFALWISNFTLIIDLYISFTSVSKIPKICYLHDSNNSYLKLCLTKRNKAFPKIWDVEVWLKMWLFKLLEIIPRRLKYNTVKLLNCIEFKKYYYILLIKGKHLQAEYVLTCKTEQKTTARIVWRFGLGDIPLQ